MWDVRFILMSGAKHSCPIYCSIIWICDVSMIIESHDGMGILNTAVIPQKGRSVIFVEENGKAVD